MLCVGSMCTRGGIHLFTLLDWYSGSWSLLVLALLEVLIVAWDPDPGPAQGLLAAHLALHLTTQHHSEC